MNSQTVAVSPVEFPFEIETENCPGGTYFRTSEVTPFLDGQTLTVFDGRGVSRSWGSSSVDSLVYQIGDDVIAVNVTGWHKHTVSPVGGWFYFLREKSNWRRVTANKREVKAIRHLLPAYGRFRGDMPGNVRRIH